MNNFIFEESVTVNSITEVKESLMLKLNDKNDISFDLSPIISIDIIGLQMIISLLLYCERKSITVSCNKISKEFTTSVTKLGLENDEMIQKYLFGDKNG